MPPECWAAGSNFISTHFLMPIVKVLYKYDLKHKGRKTLFQSSLLSFSLFLVFQVLFFNICDDYDWVTFETITFHSPTPDLGDTIGAIMDHALWVCWFFWSYHRGILLPWGLVCWNWYGKKSLPLSHNMISLFHANFDQLFFAGIIGLDSATLPWIQYLVAIFITFSITQVISKVCIMALSCGRGTSELALNRCFSHWFHCHDSGSCD